MNLNDRQIYILDKIKEKKSIQVAEVINVFKVSGMTIRRDLTELENAGLVVRKFGIASSPALSNQLFSFDDKLHVNRHKKEIICKIAAAEIEEKDVIFIDSGSTLYFLANYLSNFENLRVITNSLPVVSVLSGLSKINVTLLGGEYDDGRKAVFGILAKKMIAEYHCHKAFIGVDGISIKHGLSSYYEKEAEISAKMLEASDKIFVLADSSKIEKDAYIKYAPINKIAAIITDKNMPGEVLEKYKKSKIAILSHE